MIRLYCEQCKEFQPVEIEPVQGDNLNPMPWGDIICADCHFVIATLVADELGIYSIVKCCQFVSKNKGDIVASIERQTKNSEDSILGQAEIIYKELDEAYSELLSLFGEAQKDDEHVEVSGAIPKARQTMSAIGRLAEVILAEVRRVKTEIG